MTPDGGFFDAIFSITIIGMLLSLVIPLVIIGLIVWAIRRNAPRRRDAAEEELRTRLAEGQIDQAEFLVRMRALHDGDDRSIT
ncbi:MAG TPA: hypothetical protein VHR16_05645 [Candidatus Limnocylindrales bacterium]|jgi:uncharacterized membrane protein|nr:hypothetical protein [Candidatus Limnocylindrales bacterium]